MYHHRKLTIYPISYRDSVGREASKSSSTLKLTGQWSAEGLHKSEMICVCSSLSGAPANIQAVTKVNHSYSIVTKTNDRTEFVGIGEVESVVSRRRLTSVQKQWSNACTDSSGVKVDGMGRNTRVETWETSMGLGTTETWSWEGQRISTQCEIEGNAHLEVSDEAVVVMMTKTLQLCRSEGPLLLEMFSYRKGGA